MRRRNYPLFALVLIVLQVFVADLLAIRLIRPDFILIFVLYMAIWEGRFVGVLVGFLLGILVDLTGVASFFGLSALGYTILGYLAGNLKDRYSKWPPVAFYLTWVALIVLHFLIRYLVTSLRLLLENPSVFWGHVLLAAAYCLPFILLCNLFLPLGKRD